MVVLFFSGHSDSEVFKPGSTAGFAAAQSPLNFTRSPPGTHRTHTKAYTLQWCALLCCACLLHHDIAASQPSCVSYSQCTIYHFMHPLAFQGKMESSLKLCEVHVRCLKVTMLPLSVIAHHYKQPQRVLCITVLPDWQMFGDNTCIHWCPHSPESTTHLYNF